MFRPNPANKAHWNNEAGKMVFRISPPAGWEVSQRLVTVLHPPQPVSTKPREVEFEAKGPERRLAQPATLPAYTLYYVCEDVNGVCMYRRQDVPITIAPLKPK